MTFVSTTIASNTIKSGTNNPTFVPLYSTSTIGCCRNAIPRRRNSTTSAFSYGFSTIPCPNVLRTSIAHSQQSETLHLCRATLLGCSSGGYSRIYGSERIGFKHEQARTDKNVRAEGSNVGF